MDEAITWEIALNSGDWEAQIDLFYLKIQPGDTLLLLSYAEFTQICQWHKGEYIQHKLYAPSWELNTIEPGEYLIRFARTKEKYKCIVTLLLSKQSEIKNNKHNPYTVPVLRA